MSFASYDPNYRPAEEQAAAEALGFGNRRETIDHHFEGARWMADNESSICLQCRSSFDDVINRRHHCRYCGGLFCKACSQKRAILPEGKCLLPLGSEASESKHDLNIPQRVCGKCCDDLSAMEGGGAVLGNWMEDHESPNCLQCQQTFNGIFITRHHCRNCGGLFCNSCTNGRLLIPLGKCLLPPSEELTRSENELDCRTPQRVCGPCGYELLPLQEELQVTMARSTVEINNDTNRNSFTRFLNLPIKITLQDEIKKATNTLNNYMPDNHIDGGDTIPKELLWGCTGIAFLTVVKGGFFFSGTVGTGCVIGRLPDGTWSAPAAICLVNVGWGFQVGGEVTDVIFVLNSMEALESFMGRAQVTLGTELGISVGPLGRTAGSDIRAGKGGVAAAFAYAHSRGLFVGVSIEAGVVINRPDVNEAFYGVNYKTRAILNGQVPQPKAAAILYKALHEVESQPAPWEIMQARMQYQPRRLAQGRGTQSNNPNYRSNRPPPSLRSQYVPSPYVPPGVANPMGNDNTNSNTNGNTNGNGNANGVSDEFDEFGPDVVTMVLTPEEQQLMDDANLAAALQDEEVAAYEENMREQIVRPQVSQSSHPAVAKAQAARQASIQQQQQQQQQLPNQGVHPALLRHGVVNQSVQGNQHPAVLRASQANQSRNQQQRPVHPAILRNGGQQAVDPRRARGAGEGQWEYDRRMRLLDARIAEMGDALPPTQREFATPSSAQAQPPRPPQQQQQQPQQNQQQQPQQHRTMQQQAQASPVVAPVPPAIRATAPRSTYQTTSSYSVAPPDGYASNSLPSAASDRYLAAPAPYGNAEDSIGYQQFNDPSNPFVAAAANQSKSNPPPPTNIVTEKKPVPDLFGDVKPFTVKSDLYDENPASTDNTKVEEKSNKEMNENGNKDTEEESKVTKAASPLAETVLPVPRVPLVTEFDQTPLDDTPVETSSLPATIPVVNTSPMTAPMTAPTPVTTASITPQKVEEDVDEDDANPFADEDDADDTGIVL